MSKYTFYRSGRYQRMHKNLPCTKPPLRHNSGTYFFLIVLTLGFGAPWAKVRVAKIVLSNTLVGAPNGFDKYISQEQTQSSALGEELGDAFDVDVGLGF
ncbi:MAG: DUF898 family protein [Sulfurimonas sp.]